MQFVYFFSGINFNYRVRLECPYGTPPLNLRCIRRRANFVGGFITFSSTNPETIVLLTGARFVFFRDSVDLQKKFGETIHETIPSQCPPVGMDCNRRNQRYASRRAPRPC